MAYNLSSKTRKKTAYTYIYTYTYISYIATLSVRVLISPLSENDCTATKNHHYAAVCLPGDGPYVIETTMEEEEKGEEEVLNVQTR